MAILESVKESVARFTAPRVVRYLESRYRDTRLENDYLRENLNTLQLELENQNYRRLSGSSDDNIYPQERVMNIIRLAVQMALKNPITVRSINVQADYVFGQGISFVAKHPLIQQVVDEFVEYRENRNVLTSHTAMLRAEKRQQVFGSMFFVLNTNTQTGRVIVRLLPTTQVDDIILDPNDRDKEWYIQHAIRPGSTECVYHPAYGIDRYSGIPSPWNVRTDEGTPHPQGEIMWDAPILHVAYNRLGWEKFAVPEVYPQLDWALVYKRTLEQWVSIIASFARMAMKVTGLSGKKQAAAAKSLLQTSVSLANPFETNPSPTSGSTALLGGKADVEPIKTAGATTAMSEADPLLNFAGCAVGLPNTFFGDAGKGNFATAKTLDRPTELKMLSRQKLWVEIFTDIMDYVVAQSAIAPEGILRQAGASYEESTDLFTGLFAPVIKLPANDDESYGPVGEPIDSTVEVFFPEILERNVADRVRSLVNAATLFGKPLTDIIPDKRLVAKLLLQALNVPNADKLIPGFVKMWEANMKAEPGQPVDPVTIPPPDLTGGKDQGAEDPSQGGAVGDNG